MKIVYLDGEGIGQDIDLSGFEQFGGFVNYPNSTPEEAAVRVKDADIVLVNKVLMNEKSLKDAKNLKLICVTATGINNLDLDYLKQRGIEYRNAAGYSTESVAQHTFAMLFYLVEKLRYFDDYVKNGDYMKSDCFTNVKEPYFELNGKTWGIIGLGAIGRQVAKIAQAFGLRVIYASASGRPAQEGYEQVDMDTLYEQSDIISIHCPLNDYTMGLINKDAFAKMKNSCIFLNLARGPIVVEEDLKNALLEGQIAAAGLDVLSAEPMEENCPLKDIKDSSRLLITPHIAWASIEARERLMDIILGHVKEFVQQ